MKMKKVLKAMVAATACACMLTVPLSIHAAEPTDGLVVDGSLLTHNDSADVTELFEWRFDNPESEVAPLCYRTCWNFKAEFQICLCDSNN